MEARVKLLLITCVVVTLFSYSHGVRVNLEGDKDLSKVNRQGWIELPYDSLTDHPMVATITIALKQRNMDFLTENAKKVSNPTSPHYGQYLTFNEIRDLTAPLPEDINKITNWLNHHSIPNKHISLNPSRDFMILKSVPIELISLLLNVKLTPFKHLGTEKIIFRTLTHYSVPTEISPLIDYIGGINSFPKQDSKFSSPYLDPHHIKAIPTGNGPIISRILPGDGQIGAFFLLRCKDGSIATNATTPCAGRPGGQVQSVAIILTAEGNAIPVTTNIPFNYLKCKTCVDWNHNSFGSNSYLCNSTVYAYNLTLNSVFCSLPPYDKVKNYIAIQTGLQTTYSDASSSNISIAVDDIYAGEFVNPLTLSRAYNIPTGYQSIGGGSQSVAEFLGQYFSINDLNTFFKTMGMKSATPIITGPNNQSLPGGEASLDIQYIMAMAQNVTTTFWSVGGLHDGQEPFDVWMTQVLNSPQSPLVHSVSYGDDEPSLSQAFMIRVNNEFIKGANKGLSILFASGDNGVNSGNPNSPGCTNQTSFVPSFPPTSPWVTAVGATQFSTQTRPVCMSTSANNIPISCQELGEIMSSTTTGSRITSGGGFSNIFAQPDYQQTYNTINNYVTNSLTNVPKGLYNASGRAYPDVAACGRNYIVIIGTLFVPVDGTSAATPTFAGIVSLLNGIRLAYNLPPLGFLNYFLYSAALYEPASYNDIIMGNNQCPEDLSLCCKYGLPAATGWDAVTGWGTPNFGVLASVMEIIGKVKKI